MKLPYLLSSSSGSNDSGSSSELTNGATYRIKNVNSSLYMQVDSAKQANGTNVKQLGASDKSAHDVWKLVNADSGYYYLISQIGDGNTYYLNVSGSSSVNGSNIEINKFTGEDSQKFLLTKNSDGSYIIKTKVSNNQSAVEVANGGKGSGENIQQWNLNNYPNQNWIFESASVKLRAKNDLPKKEEDIVKTEIYKDDGLVHTVVFVK